MPATLLQWQTIVTEIPEAIVTEIPEAIVTEIPEAIVTEIPEMTKETTVEGRIERVDPLV
jgi:hypothetical protein